VSTETNQSHAEEYTFEEISVLQALWGEGFLSPSGEAHLEAIVGGLFAR
jgi:hypothetical protein